MVFPVLVWIVVGGMSLGASILTTLIVLRSMRARAILDQPNDRSSHKVATPVGGGIAVIGVIAMEWMLVWVLDGAGNGFTYPIALLVILAVILAAVSWIDDVRGLSVVLRLLVQAFAVLIGIAALSAHGRIFQGLLPYGLDVVLTTFIWLWFINLTNFMDGIDGITGVETGSISIGVLLIAPFAIASGAAIGIFLQPSFGLFGLVVGAAGIGFLIWNWAPARIFMGDVGAVPLGFLLGWMLLELAGSGLWIAALILPLYYLADSTLTLARRLLRRETITEAHRSHFYQQAAIRLGSHSVVVVAILALNIALVALAFVASAQPQMAIPALLVAAALTAILIWYFGRGGDTMSSNEQQ